MCTRKYIHDCISIDVVLCVVYWTEQSSIVYVHVSRGYDVIHSRMRTSSFLVYKVFCKRLVEHTSQFKIKSLLLVPLTNITSGDEDLRIYSDGEAGPRRLV